MEIYDTTGSKLIIQKEDASTIVITLVSKKNIVTDFRLQKKDINLVIEWLLHIKRYQ